MLTSKVGIRVSAAIATGIAALLIAQNPVTPANNAVLFGTVTDASGAIVIQAKATARSVSSGGEVSASTDTTGRYELSLPAGEYAVTIESPGFKHDVKRFTLAAGSRVQHDVTLQVGAASEMVTVTSSAPLLSTTSSSMSTRSARAERDRIPAQGIRRRGVKPDSEDYDRYLENELQSTRSKPLSTFAVDVDTASYSNARRFLLNEGRLPPTNAVRLEEMVNYFQYNYPAPEPGKPVSLTAVLTDCPWNAARQLLQIGLRTKPIEKRDLPPSNLTFLIDVSGSMEEPNKLPLVQQALRMLVRELRSQDHVAMVVYAGAAGTVLEPTPGDKKDEILAAIDRLQAGGSTHGSQGIRLAYETARRTFQKGGSNRVILATDGDFNVGVTSNNELVELIEHERSSGVFLSVLGFGTGNLKDSRMEKLADHGNGTYAYVDSLSEARRIFVEQTGATLVTVAKDVKLQIEFNPGHVKAWRLVGYENRLLRDEEFNDDTKDAGDMGAGHQVTAFYEITPAGSSDGVDELRYQRERPEAARKTAELGWLKLRWKEPTSDKSTKTEWALPAKAIRLADATADTRFAVAVAEYAMLLRHSTFAPQASFDHALETARRAMGGESDDPEGHRAEFTVLARKARDLTSESTISRR